MEGGAGMDPHDAHLMYATDVGDNWPLLYASLFIGRYYYEATVTDEGLCRVGWSTAEASMNLGKSNSKLLQLNSAPLLLPF